MAFKSGLLNYKLFMPTYLTSLLGVLVQQQRPLLVKHYVAVSLHIYHQPNCASAYCILTASSVAGLLIYLCSDITLLNTLFNKVCFITFDSFYSSFTPISYNVTSQLNVNTTVVHTQFDLFILYHMEQQKQLSC